VKLFENRALGRIFGPRKEDVTGTGEKCIMRSLIICILHQLLLM
jgi:hypothetical protein